MEIGLVEVDVLLYQGEKRRVAVRQVNRRGSSAGKVLKTDCQCEALLELSASQTPEHLLGKPYPTRPLPVPSSTLWKRRRLAQQRTRIVIYVSNNKPPPPPQKKAQERTNIFLPSTSAILLRSRYSARTMPAGHSLPPHSVSLVWRTSGG